MPVRHGVYKRNRDNLSTLVAEVGEVVDVGKWSCLRWEPEQPAFTTEEWVARMKKGAGIPLDNRGR